MDKKDKQSAEAPAAPEVGLVDGRRERKERRKKRFLPYFGKNQRKVEIVREAEVFEILLPPLKVTADRRTAATRRTKPR